MQACLVLIILYSAPCDLRMPRIRRRACRRAGRRLRHWTRNRKCEVASPWKRPRKRNLLPGKGRTKGKLHYDLASQSSLWNRKWSRDGRDVPLDGVLPGLGPQRPGAFGCCQRLEDIEERLARFSIIFAQTPHSGHLVHVHAGGLSPRVETLGDVMGSLRTNRSPEHDSDRLRSRSSCSPHSVASTLPERSRSVMGTLNF